jgi:hypothetical protein
MLSSATLSLAKVKPTDFQDNLYVYANCFLNGS